MQNMRNIQVASPPVSKNASHSRITVVKFGGTSLGTAYGFESSRSRIITAQNTGIVVVSAPGKAGGINRAPAEDRVKVTDRLIRIRDAGKPLVDEIGAIEGRFADIENGLGLGNSVSGSVEQEIALRLGRNDDSLVALGEFLSAKLMVNYLNESGVPARFVDPGEIGFLVHFNGSSFAIDRSLYETVESRVMNLVMEGRGILVVPGFYGYDASGSLRTFSRGGSDYTATVIAAAVFGAHLNCTDTDGIRTVEPQVYADAMRIPLMTHRELFALTSGGAFGILQHEAVQPLLSRTVPTRVVNTFDPDSEGTLVSATLQNDGRHEVAGIVSRGSNRVAIVGEQIGNSLVERAVEIIRNAGAGIRRVSSSGISRTLEIVNLQANDAAREIYLNLVHQ